MAEVRLGIFVKRDPRPDLNERMPIVEVDREDVPAERAGARVVELLGGEPDRTARDQTTGVMFMSRGRVLVQVHPVGDVSLDPLNTVGMVSHGHLYVRKRSAN